MKDFHQIEKEHEKSHSTTFVADCDVIWSAQNSLPILLLAQLKPVALNKPQIVIARVRCTC